MKVNLIFVFLFIISGVCFSQSQTESEVNLVFGGLLENRKTGEQMVMRCAQANCLSFNIYILTQGLNNQVKIEKLNKEKIKSDDILLKNSGFRTYDTLENAFVAIDRDNDIKKIYHSTGEYWFFITGNTVRSGFPIILLTPLTVVLDASLVIVDSAVAAGYVAGRFFAKDTFKWKKGIRLVRVLKNSENKDNRTISDSDFQKLAQYLRQSF